jgi:hypothetical protein
MTAFLRIAIMVGNSLKQPDTEGMLSVDRAARNASHPHKETEANMIPKDRVIHPCSASLRTKSTHPALPP